MFHVEQNFPQCINAMRDAQKNFKPANGEYAIDAFASLIAASPAQQTARLRNFLRNRAVGVRYKKARIFMRAQKNLLKKSLCFFP